MVLPSDVRPNHFLLEAEFVLTTIAVMLAFVWPKVGAGFFGRVERSFARLAENEGWAVAGTGLAVILLRAALLPLFPIPLPFVPDDFSFLLASDTFVHGRLTNPTPAMWTHFESIHITMQPTYQSMYFPGQGLLLAAGQVLFHQRWLAAAGDGWADVRGAGMDAARMAAEKVGAAGRSDCGVAAGTLQLLDQHVPRGRGFAKRVRWGAGSGQPAAIDEDWAISIRDC